MKKKMLLGLLVAVPLLTACGSNGGSNGGSAVSGNTITCEYKSSGTSEGYIFAFDKNDKLAVLSMFEELILDEVDFSDDYIGCSSKEECLKNAESYKEECSNDSDFENCRVETTDNTITVIGDFTSASLEANKYYTKGMTKDEIKKQAKEDGLTCR